MTVEELEKRVIVLERLVLFLGRQHYFEGFMPVDFYKLPLHPAYKEK